MLGTANTVNIELPFWDTLDKTPCLSSISDGLNFSNDKSDFSYKLHANYDCSSC